VWWNAKRSLGLKSGLEENQFCNVTFTTNVHISNILIQQVCQSVYDSYNWHF
jgi:hypothetical protein